MDGAAWLGLTLGAVIGGGYASWQGWVLRRESRAALSTRLLAGTALRLALLVVTLLAAARFTPANRWWLTGSLAVSYSGLFFWELRRALSQKK